MSTNPNQTRWTEAEYLAFEAQSDTRYEFIDGQVRAMVGASRNHNLITVNITGLLLSQLRDKPCENYQGDMAVRLSNASAYYYPDNIVVCGDPAFHADNNLQLLNPTIVFEVLSPSTDRYDQGEKLIRYQAIPSLQHYVIVSQTDTIVQIYTRWEGNEWKYQAIMGKDASVTLTAIDCILPLSEIYRRVQFPQPEEPNEQDTKD